MIATDLKTGKIYKENGAPQQVVKYEHIKTARSGGTVKVKVKNLLTGHVLEKTYVSDTKVEDADVITKNAQYLYKSGGYVFMDPQSYEQITISENVIGSDSRFLIEGDSVKVLYFEGDPVSIELPITVEIEVKYTEPGFKGNTITNVFKEATLINDAIVKVPTFIKIGDKIKVDTRSGAYVSKA